LPMASSSWSAPANQNAAQTTSPSDDASGQSTAKSEPLPQTASPLPLVGLIGLLAVVGIVVLRRISRTS
jgi:cobalamin biosynthesis Mg chelatase CobN